jgi:PAS domain-containing protein
MQGNLEASSLDVLSSALDLARVGLARWDTDDRLVAFNNTYRSLVYPNQQDEVRLGRKFEELARAYYGQPANVPPGRTTDDMVAERLKRHAAQSTSFEYHSNKRWFRVAERRTPDGGAVGVYIDVTEERRNELMAREGERPLRLLFDNMRNIAYCLGTRGTSGFGYDHDGVKVYGRDAVEMFGTISKDGYADVDAWYKAVHPDDRERYLAAEQERRARGGLYDLEYRFIHPVTQQLRWAREVGWISEDPERQQESLESYIIDITEAKEREAFSRSAASFTTPEGTGLGLPISRSFAELHGGTLGIESRRGHGTTLRLHLPTDRVLGPETP